jgi:hypothetical protein
MTEPKDLLLVSGAIPVVKPQVEGAGAGRVLDRGPSINPAAIRIPTGATNPRQRHSGPGPDQGRARCLARLHP